MDVHLCKSVLLITVAGGERKCKNWRRTKLSAVKWRMRINSQSLKHKKTTEHVFHDAISRHFFPRRVTYIRFTSAQSSLHGRVHRIAFFYREQSSCHVQSCRVTSDGTKVEAKNNPADDWRTRMERVDGTNVVICSLFRFLSVWSIYCLFDLLFVIVCATRWAVRSLSGF